MRRPRRLLLAGGLCLLAAGGAAFGQGSLLLAGGGSEGADGDATAWSWRPYGWFVGKALSGGPNGGNGRILVIDYEDYPQCGRPDVGYCAYFESLGAVEAEALWLSRSCPPESGPRNSVCVDPEAPEVYARILSYDGVWFRGGDPSRYVEALEDTRVERALFHLFLDGGVLGGTSAGAMILSEVVSVGDARSHEATADPYHPALRLDLGFLSGASAVLPGVVVDSHLTERARLGRLAVFVGRRQADAGEGVLGIGLDSETALTVEPSGVATVHGQGAVTFLRWTASSEALLRRGMPPYLTSLRVDQLTDGFVYDLSGRRVASVPAGAEPASDPPERSSYGPGVLSGASDGHRRKGEWWADWGGAEALLEGTVVERTGSGLVDNGVVVTLLEDKSSLRENRAGSAQWLLRENPSRGLALYLDGFNGLEFNRVRVRADETLAVLPPGDTPEESVLILDCAGLEWVAGSSWDPDGDGAARQSVALTPCRLHLLNSRIGKSVYDAKAHAPVDPTAAIAKVR